MHRLWLRASFAWKVLQNLPGAGQRHVEPVQVCQRRHGHAESSGGGIVRTFNFVTNRFEGCAVCGKDEASQRDNDKVLCDEHALEAEMEPDLRGNDRDEWKHEAAEWQRLK